MAKFAIVILAALAFQAASAGVHRHHQQEKILGDDYKYGLELQGYPTGKFDALFGQLQTVSQDLTVYFQKPLSNDRLVLKTLTYQCRELAQYIDTIIEKLQAVAHNYSGQVSIVLEQVISELREIQMQYHKIAGYTTDVSAVSQMKNQFYMTVQRTVAQLEKLVRLVQTDVKQTEGQLYVIVKNVITDFLYAFQNIYTHVQYYGVYGEQSPRQLVLQIQEVTQGLTGYLQGVTRFDAQRRYAVREYIQHVEAIFTKMQQVEGIYGNAEIQQVYNKLRRVLVPFVQMVESESMENVEIIRVQLIKELQFVAEAFEQFVQYAQAGEHQTFFFEILGDYLYTIQHFRMQMQTEYQSSYGLYQGQYYGKQGFQGIYGKSGYQGLYKDAALYGKTGYQGLYKDAALYGKTGYQGLYKDAALYGKTGYQGLYKDAALYGKTGYQGLYKDAALYGKTGYQGLYKDSELYGKTGYQGLYKYGGLYSKSGYGKGFSGKYQEFAKYGQDLKQFEVQIQTIIRDFYQVFQTVSFDDVTVRQNFVHLIREYAQQLEVIVERLHQYVNYNAETDVYVFQQVAQNLKKYVVALQQFYTSEISATEFKTEFYMYVQRIAAEFQKLIAGFEQTHGTFYDLVQNVLVQYLTATHEMYRMMENINTFPQYGYSRQYYGDNTYSGKYYGKYFGGKYGQYYGQEQEQQVYETPRELVNQIEIVARDLSATFQNGMYFSQQHAQVFSAQARHFAQIIKNVIDQLEAYEHIDATIQQVIYKLREVQMSFQKLATYDVFTNIHQLRAEFDSYIQIAVAQIEKLVLIAQEETHGNFYYAIKSVLHFFLYGLHDIHYQLQEVAQYGQFAQYGKGYGYGFEGKYGYGKYGQQYGFGKYGQQYGFGKYGQQYGQDYGFAKYGQQYGFPKYGQDYSFAKYGQQYEFPKYGQDYSFAKYGQQYEFPKYGQQYGQQYGYGKYGQQYGFDKYTQGLMGLSQYGKGYGYAYPSQYGYQHVPSTQYEQVAVRGY